MKFKIISIIKGYFNSYTYEIYQFWKTTTT